MIDEPPANTLSHDAWELRQALRAFFDPILDAMEHLINRLTGRQ